MTDMEYEQKEFNRKLERLQQNLLEYYSNMNINGKINPYEKAMI